MNKYTVDFKYQAVMPYYSFIGVVYAYAALYLFAFVLTYLLKVKQPGFDAPAEDAQQVG